MEYPYIIKALVDRPRGGDIKKGEVGILMANGLYDFPSQNSYIVSNIDPSKFEIIQQNKEQQYEIF